MKSSVVRKFAVFCSAVLALAGARVAVASEDEILPKELQGVTIKEHLGDQLDLSTSFTDADGKAVQLGDYFKDGKPVLLTLNYYKCKMLCGLQLNAVVDGLRQLKWKPGNEFRIVTISIDSRNTPEMAAEKRDLYKKALGLGGDVDWNFLVGNDEQINKIASQVGFEFKYDPIDDQFAHGLGIFFVTGEGVLSRYLYGLEYLGRDMKFALIDSAAGKIGTSVDRFILNCFHYDETRGKYGPSAMRVMRMGGFVTVACLGAGFVALRRREKAQSLRSQNRV